MKETTSVTFEVAMNAEEKKAKRTRKVTFDVTFEGVDDAVIIKHAIANCIVGWQSQIRSHWTEFVAGKLPSKVVFGQPLFTSSRGTVAVITAERAEEHILKQDRLTQVRLAIKLMNSIGQPVPDSLLEEEILLKMEAEEADPTPAA